MLLINNNELSRTKTDDVVENYIKEKFDHLRKTFGGKTLNFRLADRLAYTAMVTNKQKVDFSPVRKFPDIVPINASSEVVIKNQRVTITYCSVIKPEPKTGNNKPEPKYIEFKNSMSVDETNIELMFFLMYVSPDVIGQLTDKDIKIITTKKESEKKILLVDEVKSAKAFIEREALVAEATYLLLNKYNEKTIRLLGLKYNISGYEVKDVVLLRKEILDKLQTLDATSKPYENVYGDFIVKSKKIDAGDKDDNDEVKALVFKAEEIGVIRRIKDASGECWYHWNMTTNKRGSKICSLGSFNDMIDAIEAELRTNEDSYKAVKTAVEALQQ